MPCTAPGDRNATYSAPSHNTTFAHKPKTGAWSQTPLGSASQPPATTHLLRLARQQTQRGAETRRGDCKRSQQRETQLPHAVTAAKIPPHSHKACGGEATVRKATSTGPSRKKVANTPQNVPRQGGAKSTHSTPTPINMSTVSCINMSHTNTWDHERDGNGG